MGIYYNLKKSLVRNLVEFSLINLSDGVGTAFPSNPVSKQTFYRADQGKLYKYNGSWQEIDVDYFFFDLDTHAEEQQIPTNSVVVLKGFSAEADEHVVSITAMVGAMIVNDTNLKKHDQVMDALFTMFLPTKYTKVWDMENGAVIGTLQATNGSEIMPMYKADQRPLQFIGVTLLSDLTLNLSNTEVIYPERPWPVLYNSSNNLILNSPLAVNKTANGIRMFGVLGEPVLFGDVLYRNENGNLYKASSTTESQIGVGMALMDYSAGQTCEYLVLGTVRDDSWNWVPGGLLYLDIITGGLTQEVPSLSGQSVQIMGVALFSNDIIFNMNYNTLTLT